MGLITNDCDQVFNNNNTQTLTHRRRFSQLVLHDAFNSEQTTVKRHNVSQTQKKSPLELPTNIAKMQSTKWLPGARRGWKQNSVSSKQRMNEAIGARPCLQASYFSVTITFSFRKMNFRLTGDNPEYLPVLYPSETPVARGKASFPPAPPPSASLLPKQGSWF